MKRTGMKRSLDRLGRIVLPKEMRDTMEIHIGDPLEFFIEGKELILRKYKSTLCIFCGDVDTEMYFKEQFICRTCAIQLKHPDDSPDWFVPQNKQAPAPVERPASKSAPVSSPAREEGTTADNQEYPDLRPKTARMLQQMKEIVEQNPGLAQQQIAEKLGISQGRVSQLKKLL
ncbi:MULTISPECIES: AbrB/MazE/SpoVT family DNA-binding domain-containing protein [Paenibacillus]|uniref:AbrB/MazE/SpoVT family DNA-binding domain-containing protein n=2 Tax=Paenibacillus TaxID=44249 RepID=UPI00064AE8FB|nr:MULTISPECIES: AbrB/MazE/SpoVT family DNA-binding domain-containing protein [Paenibacillus]APO42827.1 regulator [Paenibacillus xylanexedens]KAA8757175.1 AbrB/MazE/SpoVT family DNA-binding domain-containing protein [Paenibacillus sp. UASWS1643]KLU57703.1 regulator [Paenibacillus sp. VT-400]MBD8840451.1 AbrB/MazE/SpoVT family DNA-binding domain-containing protein [Paenibacillus sp. CFBP 13594]MBY0115613.1 AbrB/MazE/SpoVT family DNA-binding domain-containing protein [Paenibacillus xylanexedens]